MFISVIIPTLNEESALEHTLKSIGRGVEIIVSDAGSHDSTIKVASRFTKKIILSERGRGSQMDRGAREAKGDVLLFLHADTKLPEDWRERVAETLKDDKVIGGGFRLKIDSKNPPTPPFTKGGKGRLVSYRNISFRIIEAMANMRSRYLGLIYGDQAIFARRDAFFAVGGFMGLPLMEDVDFIKRLKKKGKVVLLDADVSTSSKHWEKKGIIMTTLRNWIFLGLYYLGISPEKLYKRYYQ
jgi:rSAM/selenodomain-associated transferase 2